MKRILLAAIGLLILALAPRAYAQSASPNLTARANQIASLFRGDANLEDMFAPEFLAAVPAAQLQAVSAQLLAQYGPIQSIARVEPVTATQAVVTAEFERATVRFNLAVQPQAPHRIIGLFVAGAEMRGDSLAAVAAEIRALPGEPNFAVARLGDAAPAMLSAHEADRPLAVGSAFKLFILAELSRQVRAGERRWSDVVPLSRRSLPSGFLQTWPQEAPITVHSLAALMISQSDNTATDTLLALVGRENVERLLPTLGVEAAARNRPFLSTLEAFVLKTSADAERRAWIGGSEAQRRQILSGRLRTVTPADADLARLAGTPLDIDGIEWFASAADLVRTVDWLRRNGDDTARAILAINPGLPSAEGLAYVGFKGGSEPGVINLTYLVRNRAGEWHAVTGSWNNPAAVVDEGQFATLLQRAVALVR